MSEAQKGVGSNHAVSGLKFRVLRPMLDLGYAVLLSDVDIITLQNPFQFLHRDSDVEGMSDGWDNATAYGVHPSLSVSITNARDKTGHLLTSFRSLSYRPQAAVPRAST